MGDPPADSDQIRNFPSHGADCDLHTVVCPSVETANLKYDGSKLNVLIFTKESKSDATPDRQLTLSQECCNLSCETCPHRLAAIVFVVTLTAEWNERWEFLLFALNMSERNFASGEAREFDPDLCQLDELTSPLPLVT